MALTYDLSKIEDWELRCFLVPSDGVLLREVECLIFATMAIGISKLSSGNAREWIERIAFLTYIGVPIYQYATQPKGKETSPNMVVLEQDQGIAVKVNSRWAWIPSLKALSKFYGLETNASPMTKSEFKQKISRIVEREASFWVSKAVRGV